MKDPVHSEILSRIIEQPNVNSPRVLIINPYPIGANCPTGIMMENLFNEYEPNSIIQYYTNPCEINEKLKFKSKEITLLGPYVKIFLSMVKKILRKNKKIDPIVTNMDQSLRTTGSNNKQLESWFHLLLPIYIDKDLIKEIQLFNPNVIYTQIHSFPMLKYINALSKKTSCPVVIHTLDDWMETIYRRDLISAIPFLFFDKIFKALLNNGMSHMVISPKMLNYMQEKYGGDYKFVMNCCNYPEVKVNNYNKIMKIVYTGGLMLERYVILDEIARSINTLNTQKKRYELHVYAPTLHIQGYKELMEKNIVFHESVDHEDVFDLMTEADILIHVESFNPNVKNYTQYSLSTKIPEYLASGRPLIYFGPEDIGVAEFLLDNKIGLCVNSAEMFEEQVRKLYNDEEYSESVAINGYRKGKEYFDATVMQSEFNSCFKK